ncbi:MAG: hypothetical protein JWO82_3500 [Akkermansiaceae bacterium]|nr:hypothetical protein [Akkermansiaceae bacterium]
MARKHTVYATRQTRYLGERAMPGDEFIVDESEMAGLISSGRFSETEDDIPEEELAAAEEQKAAAESAKSKKTEPAK